MKSTKLYHRLLPMGLAAAALTAACQQDRLAIPGAVAPQLTVGLEASSTHAAPGARIAVAVRAEGEDQAPVAGLQGVLRFDATRLRYVGQSAGGVLTIVNTAEAERGALRVASLNPGGLPLHTAVLVFEVRSADYARDLRYDAEVAATLEAEPVAMVKVERGVFERSDLLVPAEAGRYTADDVARRLYPDVWAADRRQPQRTPGQYLLNLRYGDANLSGGINILDAADVANTAVGNNEIIIGTDAPSRDRVVAANVRPQNGTGLGEPTDPVPPGREANGTRVINILDAVAVANEAVGNDQTIAGELIPGRGALASNRAIVSGSITADRTFFRDSIYELRGIVQVDNAATLTIEAGTRVEGQTDTALTGGVPSALFVNRNGRIVADGTPLQPIVLTCTGVKAKGCWGGLWIAGNAPINNLTGSLTATSPVIPGRAATGGCFENVGEGGATQYGGCNPDDSSGVLRYVVEEYSGKVIAANNELNGITMGGVGRGTVVEFIQVHAGLDDGLELFGGTVNVKGLYSTGNSDDSFDFCCGWSGNAQFVVIQHDTTDSDKGIEADNTEVTATYESGPFTNGQIWNLTFVGRLSPTGGVGGNASNDAFHLRRGTSPALRNVMVINPRSGLDLDDAATCTDAGGSGIVSIESSLFAGHGTLGNADGSDPTCATAGGNASTEATFITQSGNQTFVSSTGILKSPFSLQLPDFRPAASLPAGVSVVGATPPAGGFFDVTATYIGAVPQANSTGSNIPWYSGWTRGF